MVTIGLPFYNAEKYLALTIGITTDLYRLGIIAIGRWKY